MDHFVLKREFQQVEAVVYFQFSKDSKVLGMVQPIFASDSDKLLLAGQQLTHTLLPLSPVTHLVVLVYLLNYRLSSQSLLLHPQNLNRLLQQGIFLRLLSLPSFNQFLYLRGNRTGRSIELHCQVLKD